MIKYEVGHWGVTFIFSLKGSVFPKAVTLSFLPTLASVLGSVYLEATDLVGENWVQVWAGYNFVLGFLLIFRTTEAYRRYWEGGTLLQQVRGEWYNACSSIVSFCNQEPQYREEVEEFQHCLVRLMSLLYCSALQQVSFKKHGLFVLDYSALDKESIKYLEKKPEKCEIILQWVQRLIVEKMRSGIVPVPPPVVTRVFQELSRGIVNMNNARKISDFLFPFPYAQMITIMLLINSLITPCICVSILDHWAWAVILTFITTTTFWSVHYIAIELEMPFGEDDNDLPLSDMQQGMNESLWTLLDEQTQRPPKFHFQKEHRNYRTSESRLLQNRHSSRMGLEKRNSSEHRPFGANIRRRITHLFHRSSHLSVNGEDKVMEVMPNEPSDSSSSPPSAITEKHAAEDGKNKKSKKEVHIAEPAKNSTRRVSCISEDEDECELESHMSSELQDVIPPSELSPELRAFWSGQPGVVVPPPVPCAELDSEIVPRPKSFSSSSVHTRAPPVADFAPCRREGPSGREGVRERVVSLPKVPSLLESAVGRGDGALPKVVDEGECEVESMAPAPLALESAPQSPKGAQRGEARGRQPALDVTAQAAAGKTQGLDLHGGVEPPWLKQIMREESELSFEEGTPRLGERSSRSEIATQPARPAARAPLSAGRQRAPPEHSAELAAQRRRAPAASAPDRSTTSPLRAWLRRRASSGSQFEANLRAEGLRDQVAVGEASRLRGERRPSI